MFDFAMFMCVDGMVMSSAYVVTFTGACGIGVSDVYMMKSVGDSTPPCGTPFLNWRFVSECGVCFGLLMYLIMVCGMFVWCSLCVSVCMFTVSNAFPMSNATVIVRSGGLFWLKPVEMVLFMLCSTVLVEWLFLKPCCVEMCWMLFVRYGSGVLSSVLLSLR